ncbi:MAG: DMT family transporter [Victivallaceae bacterium]|nr:DMT family transporter [Victivallaceae bacterium]
MKETNAVLVPSRKKTLIGLFCGCIAAISYGMNPLFALPLYSAGMATYSVLFYRYFFAIVILFVLLKCKKIPLGLSREDFWYVLIAGLLMVGSSLSLFLSYRRMDAGIASTLLFVYPLMVAGIMTVFFREKLSPVTAGSIVFALAGISLLYRGGDGKLLDTRGVILVMTSSLTYACYLVLANQAVLRRMNSMKLTFYILCFGEIVYLILLGGGRNLQSLPSPSTWVNAVMLALVPTVISFVCTARSVALIGSTPTAILGALEPLTAVFFGILIFHEKLTLRGAVGILLILSAVTLVTLLKRRGEESPLANSPEKGS